MMERISTGSAGLDKVLGGGFPLGSLIVVGGPPGTGKTILAQQVCFANASSENRALYYTTLSEPHTKMIRHLQPFGFFDADGLGSRVNLINLTGIYSSDEEGDGLKGAFSEVIKRCFEDSPSVVVVDSSKALREYDEPLFRQAVYELASAVAHTNAVLLFVGEYTPEEMVQSPEFAVADGIIELSNEDHGPISRRFLRVRKMRGSGYLSGRHSVDITDDGMTVFPRLETARLVPSAIPTERRATGVKKLDELMHGGPLTTDASLLLGPSGVGKSTMALQFACEGVQQGERCLYVSLQEDEGGLRRRAEKFGLTDSHNGALIIRHVPPVEVDLDQLGVLIQDELANAPVERVVIDSLAEISYAVRETERLPGYIFTLLGLVGAAGASTVITSETTLFGPAKDAASGLMASFQNVLALRFIDLDGEMRRAMSVLNMRHSRFEPELLEFSITDHGIEPTGVLHGVSGSLGLTGLHADSNEEFEASS